MRSVGAILGCDLPGLVRLEVIYQRVQRFRWFFLLEIFVFGGCMAVWLGLFVVASFLFGQLLPAELLHIPVLGLRPWRYELVIEVVAYAGDGSALARRVFNPPREERFKIQLGLLRAADDDRVVVREYFLSEKGDLVGSPGTWYGGQPAMAAPADRDEEDLQQTLARLGHAIQGEGEAVQLMTTTTEPDRGQRIVAGVILALGVLLSPILVLTRGGRRWLVEVWMTARGLASSRSVIRLDRHGVGSWLERGGWRWEEHRTSWDRLIGFTRAPPVPSDRAVTLDAFTLAVVCADETWGVDWPWRDHAAVHQLLVATSHRLWHGEHSALGSTHCGFCGTLYAMRAGTKCPHCGAPAGLGEFRAAG